MLRGPEVGTGCMHVRKQQHGWSVVGVGASEVGGEAQGQEVCMEFRIPGHVAAPGSSLQGKALPSHWEGSPELSCKEMTRMCQAAPQD